MNAVGEDRDGFKKSKILSVKEEEFRRQKNSYLQRIEILEGQLLDYKEKQALGKKLNESIMMSYRQNQSFRDQISQKQLTSLTNKFEEEIKKMRQKHQEERKKGQEQINQLKEANQKLKIEVQRNKLENDKRMAEVRDQFQKRLKDRETDLQAIYDQKISFLSDQLKQSNNMASLYKEFMSKRRDQINIGNSHQKILFSGEYKGKQNLLVENAIKSNQQSYKLVRESKQNLQGLSLRINRALTQLKPNKESIQHRINKLRSKNI